MTSSQQSVPQQEELTQAQMRRYARHILLPQVDFTGQEALLRSHVLVLGAGGLGCAVLPYLVSSGVGRISLIDDDQIEVSNLQRQTLYQDQDVGEYKAQVAIKRLQDQNPDCQLQAYTERITTPEQLQQLLGTLPDAVVDCTDNVAIRNTLNQFCYTHKVPFISGSAIRFEGQVTVFPMRSLSDEPFKDEPCYQCFSAFFGEQQLSCMEAGVFAPLVGVIGTLQAVETLKILTQIGTPLAGYVLLYDGLSAEFKRFKLPKNPLCSLCA